MKYVFKDGRFFTAGDQSGFYLEQTHGNVVELCAEDALLAKRCDRFRTLQEHRAALIAAGWPEWQSGDLMTRLREWVTRGLMWSDADLLRMPATTFESMGSVEWVGITGEVDSIPSALLETGVPIVVAGPEDRATQLPRVAVGATRLLGPRERYRLGQLLTAESRELSPEVVDSALCGTSPDALRNALMLSTAGSGGVCVSTGTHLIRPESATNDKIALSSETYPEQLFSWKSRHNELSRTEGRVWADWVRSNEELLGAEAGDLLRNNQGTIDLSGVDGRFVSRLMRAGGKVAVVACGVWTTEGAKMARSRRRSLAAHVVARPTVWTGRQFAEDALAWDSRLLLPPFPVSGLSGDVFSATLLAVHPDALIALVPYATGPTWSVPPRSLAAEPPTANVLLGDAIELLAGQMTSAEPKERMLALASALESLAKEDGVTFDPWVKELRVRHLALRIRGFQNWLSVGAPVRRRLVAPEEHADFLRNMALTPMDSAELAEARELFASYGKLLQAWPRMMEISRELVAAGRMPLVPLGPA